MSTPMQQLLFDLISFDSSAGYEAAICDYMFKRLQASFTSVVVIPVERARFNLLAFSGAPTIIFSTHLDVVPAKPQMFTPRIEDGRILGRGACDAKGIAACMLQACDQLLQENENDFGVLFVVGEETCGDGAIAARPKLAEVGTKYLINGEPTSLKMITSQFGAIDLRLTVLGKAAHSGYPERGVDANRILIDALSAIERNVLSQDPNALVNFGKISGGSAANVLSSYAQAEFCIRSEKSSEEVLALVKQSSPPSSTLELTFQSQPIKPMVLPGFESAAAKFASDLPSLLSAGMHGILFGPGDIHLAHTDAESISLLELEAGVSGYKQIYKSLKEQYAQQ